MHSYLRAIGFSKLEQKDLDQILQEVIVSCDEKKIAEQGKNEIFAELSRYFGMNIGLRVCGTYDEQDQFRMEYYFPYFVGSGITSQEDVMVEQRSEKVCFSGACDDVRVGVTLIFYLANAGEYLTERIRSFYGGQDFVANSKKYCPERTGSAADPEKNADDLRSTPGK